MNTTPTPGDLSARQVIADMQSVAELRTIRHSYIGEKLKGWIAALSALPAAGDSVWMFKDRQGQWCAFSSDKHRENTIASGEWEVRQFFTTPQPSAAEDYESWAKQERQRQDTATRLGSAAVGAQGDGITADWVLGYLPVNIEGWKNVPEGYMPGYNDALQLCRDGVRFAFAEHRALAAPAAGKGVDDAMVERAWAAYYASLIAVGPDNGNGQKAMRAALEATLTRQPVAGDGPRHCRWTQEDEGGDFFDVGCGHSYIVNDAETAGMKFCVYCGDPIEFSMWKPEDDAAPAATPTDGGEGKS